MLVYAKNVVFLGVKKDLQKNDRTFSLYSIFDPVSTESVTVFSSKNYLADAFSPMTVVDCQINVRNGFLNLEHMSVAEDV